MKKSQKSIRQITVAEMAPHVHSFAYGENKVSKIYDWLSNWITKSLKSKKIKSRDFLPSKRDLAFHIGVSLGTIQNVYRLLEDAGLIQSKQKVGSFISAIKEKNVQEKLTSKREMACEAIKRYIIDNKFKVGDALVSTRKLAKIIEISPTTVIGAINTLIANNILVKQGRLFIIRNINFELVEKENLTLVEKISKKIKKLISQNTVKLPSNHELACTYKVSIKTIHDALKLLAKEGMVITKRGQYGTLVANNQRNSESYIYEKVEQKIKNYIYENCQIGDKLPPIQTFAKNYNVSTKTIKKALDNMLQDGYIRFSRGRYGGTFVVDVPQNKDNYKWLALNPEFM